MFFTNVHLFTSCFKRILPVFVLLFLAVLLVAVIFPTSATGLMAYVDAAVGNDVGDCSNPAAPCLTINYAIGQTGDGSYIAVAGGEYVENVKLMDGFKRTIRGGYTNNGGDWTLEVFDPWINPTVINGNNVDSTIEIRNHTDTIIDGVTIKGGKGLIDPTFGNGCGGLKIQSSDVDIVQSAISGNDGGTGEGGALCAAGDDGKMTLLIESTIVEGNRAEVAGAFSLFNTTTTIVNSLIMDNKSNSNYANVMTLLHDDDVWVLNSTIAYNNPTGDQAVDITSGKLAVQNSIMWHNSLNLQATPPCPTCFDVTYSNIEQAIAGTGNISEDPMFLDPAIRNLQLHQYSPCIDAGTTTDAPAKDIDWTPRDAKPDMGAYEFVPRAVGLMAYVDAAVGEDTGDCSDPTAPCLTINYAIGQTGDEGYIAVAEGEYVENVRLRDSYSRTIRGGYANDAGEWKTEPFDPWVNPTIINGNHIDSTIEIRSHTDTIIDGVTIKGGKGLNDPTFGNGCGGLKIQSSDVDIVQSAISGNDGGTGEGGALCAAGDDGKMTLLIESTIVEGNRAEVAGAFSLFNTTTTIVNSLIMDNKSNSNYANVMTLLHDDDVWVLNSTIAYNNPTGDQAVDITSGKLAVQNSIMWKNSLNLQATPPCPACFDVTYSDIEQTVAGTGNISKDPNFRDPVNHDFQLRWYSPAIDAGTAVDAPVDDIDGTPRDDKPDMGAYEYVAPIVYLAIVIDN